MLKKTLLVVLVGSFYAQAMDDLNILVNVCEIESFVGYSTNKMAKHSEEIVTEEIKFFNDMINQTPPTQNFIDRRYYGYTIEDKFFYSGNEKIFLKRHELGGGSKDPRRFQASTARTVFHQSEERVFPRSDLSVKLMESTTNF